MAMKILFKLLRLLISSINFFIHFKYFLILREFVKKYNLEIIAANFVQAEWDEYVPVLYKQLGF